MKRARTLVVLGVLLIVVPFLGLPYAWLMTIVPVFGAILLAFGVSFLRAPRPAPEAPPHDAPEA